MFIDGGRRNFKKFGHLFLAQPDSFILYKYLNFWAISFTEEEWIWERKTTEIVSVQLLIGKYFQRHCGTRRQTKTSSLYFQSMTRTRFFVSMPLTMEEATSLTFILNG